MLISFHSFWVNENPILNTKQRQSKERKKKNITRTNIKGMGRLSLRKSVPQGLNLIYYRLLGLFQTTGILFSLIDSVPLGQSFLSAGYFVIISIYVKENGGKHQRKQLLLFSRPPLFPDTNPSFPGNAFKSAKIAMDGRVITRAVTGTGPCSLLVAHLANTPPTIPDACWLHLETTPYWVTLLKTQKIIQCQGLKSPSVLLYEARWSWWHVSL